MAVAARRDRADLLRTYTIVYLEKELRRESLVKDWPAFARFLQLAAAEAGRMINYAAVSREAGVSLLSTERFYFFDLGVRNAAAELPLEPAALRADPGPLFEQWVAIELWKRLQYLGGGGKLHYLRSKGGAEVGCIVARGSRLAARADRGQVAGAPGTAT